MWRFRLDLVRSALARDAFFDLWFWLLFFWSFEETRSSILRASQIKWGGMTANLLYFSKV